jgi:hypothetical protein
MYSSEFLCKEFVQALPEGPNKAMKTVLRSLLSSIITYETYVLEDRSHTSLPETISLAMRGDNEILLASETQIFVNFPVPYL